MGLIEPIRMSKRTDPKARATSRNLRRAAINAMAAAKTLDPIQVRRAEIRSAKVEKSEKERRLAVRLLRPHVDPEPDETVRILLLRAEGQVAAAKALEAKAKVRGKAGFQARHDRKAFLDEAKRLEMEAARARATQLDQHWNAMAAAEITSLDESAARCEKRERKIERTETETHEFVRDEHGALQLDEHGFPKLQTLKATPLRRSRRGLDWLRDKGRITPEQYRIGQEAGAIWEAAALAAEPGRAELGTPRAPSGKSSPGPADWRLDAFRIRKSMEVAILSYVEGEDGERMVRTCKSVCYEGNTVSNLAGGARYEQVRLEEQLKLGLALIRYWIYAGGQKMSA